MNPTTAWPPPGLAPLLGAGHRLLRNLAALGLLVVLLFGWLSRQPVAVTPLWYSAVLAARRGVAAAPRVPVSLWDIGVGALAVLIAILGAALLIQSLSVARRLTWARRQRYPWDVLLDVALDQRGDTAELIDGTGPFAGQPPAIRQRLLRLRRARAGTLVLAIALVMLGALSWRLGWLAPSVYPSILVTAREIVTGFTPALLAVITYVLLDLPESQRRRHRPSRAGTGEDVAAAVVTQWLEGAGRGTRLGAPRGAAWALTTLPAWLTMLFGLVLGLTLLPTFVAQGLGGSYLRNWGRASALAYLDEIQADSGTAPWEALDSLLGAGGTSAGARAAPDTAALLALAALSVASRAVPPGWTVDPARFAAWQDSFHLDLQSVAAKVDWVDVPRGLPDPVRARLAADTAVPALALWRRLARSGPLPPYAMYGPGLGGLGALQPTRVAGVPLAWREVILSLARRNLGAAALAVAAGRTDVALGHVRENLAALARLAALPHHALGTGGVDAALSATFDALRVLATLRHDPALAREADALADAQQGVLRRRQLLADVALMMDPEEPPGLRVLARRDVAPLERWRLIAAIADAPCFSPREVLFGVHPGRARLLDVAAREAADIPRTAEWVALKRHGLEWFEARSAAGRILYCLNM